MKRLILIALVALAILWWLYRDLSQPSGCDPYGPAGMECELSSSREQVPA